MHALAQAAGRYFWLLNLQHVAIAQPYLLCLIKHAQASDDFQQLHSRRETRYFATWKRPRETEEHGLPPAVRAATGQTTCPIGDAALRCEDAVLAAETCEELFTPASPHIALALSGVEIVGNGKRQPPPGMF